MSDTRLIERWLPITEIGIESLRERTPMTPFPAPNRLHVWWARRPLIASRAAILASVLPESADKEKFLHALGIHGDPMKARRAMDQARRTGIRVVDPYGYSRAFGYSLSEDDKEWIQREIGNKEIVVIDPTSGGGSIPLEAARLGFSTLANDLNPVASLLLKATIEWPNLLWNDVEQHFDRISDKWRKSLEGRLAALFPQHRMPEEVALTYIWARTIKCPYCSGVIPLSPNWRLSTTGDGIRIVPARTADKGPRVCQSEVVEKTTEQSPGTVSSGDATCPFHDCGRVVDGDEVKRQAQEGKMGEQLVAVAVKRQILTTTKTGKAKVKWTRGYRAPLPSDDVSEMSENLLREKLPEWHALGIVPTEQIPDGLKTSEPLRYGMNKWTDLFSPRQLLCHGYAVECFQELYQEEEQSGLTESARAAFVYLALAIDKIIDYNARLSYWDPNTQRARHVFGRHDLSFMWSYAELDPVYPELGYDWAIQSVKNCVRELIVMLHPSEKHRDLLTDSSRAVAVRNVTVTCKSGDSLDHVNDSSVDVVVMDPPYYDNVMYAELADFFYVWLKRTAGHVVPSLFTRQLTDKDREAVANPSRFKDQKGAKALAGKDYQQRMASIFGECRRMLKPDGVLTLMFTHKATGAWDALTKGLMSAGFTITSSWPINTESEGGLHIKNKAAANSTIFLVCRPRESLVASASEHYWEDVEPRVAQIVRQRIEGNIEKGIAGLKDAGIGGVDLYLASFGPALEEFSKHWPLKRGTPRTKPESLKRRRQTEMFEEEYDPYEVTPEDALDAARREVKRWKLEQLTHMKGNAELDPATSWFVLAWDAFRATVFDYDEALRLARAVGVDLEKDIIGWLAEKKGSDVRLWDSATRAAKGSLGPADGSRAIIDAVHHAAHVGRTRNLAAAHDLLAKNFVDQDPKFFASLEAVLEVLPVSKAFSGIELEGDVAGQGSDFEILENLRRLAYSDKVDEPKQLDLWKDEAAAA